MGALQTPGDDYLEYRYGDKIPGWLDGTQLTVDLLAHADEWVTDQCPVRDRHHEYGSCLTCGLGTESPDALPAEEAS